MKKTMLLIVSSILLFFACDKEEAIIPEETKPYLFQDGFESINQNLNDLLVADGSRWTGIQQVNPNNGENKIELEQLVVKEGNHSLKITAKPSDDILSKMDIEKQGFSAPVGSTISIEADFRINSTANLQELFLIDLECCSCWDSNVPNNQCPGIRLKLSGDNNYLSIERGKILGTTLNQTALAFPRNEWVHVKWVMSLAPDETGTNSLTINNQELININGKNMPNPEEFRNEFAMNGIDFELQTPLTYERVQIGATANPTEEEVEIFIDNFSLKIE